MRSARGKHRKWRFSRKPLVSQNPLARSANPVHILVGKSGDSGLIRKYWFEIFHAALWVAIGVMIFYQKPVALAVGLFGLMLCAFAFALNAVRKDMKAALLILAAPLVILAIVLPLNRSHALDWVEFHSAKPLYEARFKWLPPPGHEPRLVAFHMDDRGWLPTGPTIFETLVYDQTDEVGKPAAQWSAAWRMRASGRLHFHSILQPISRSHSVTVTAMGDHWFWVEQVMR